MILALPLSILSFSLIFAFSANANPINGTLKKISVVETNNSPDYLTVGKWVAQPVDANYLKKLRGYVEKKGFRPQTNAELDFVKSALDWVTSQWSHDGVNEAPESFRGLEILQSVHKKKSRYRCVEYGVVLTDLLQAYGFVARKVALRSVNVAYGGFGQGHVALEVWLNDIQKWIFLDPQFGAYLTKKNSPEALNYFEIFQQKKAGSWDDLQVHFTEKANVSAFHPDENPDLPTDTAGLAREYRKFLIQYFGFITFATSKDSEQVSLFLDSKDQPLTFQGRPAKSVVFTRRPEIAYPEMNRVALDLKFRDNHSTTELLNKLKIETNEDYLKHMAAFAAEPRFRVHIMSAQASRGELFEYRTLSDGKWKALKSDSFDWDALSSMNYLAVRSVNSFGRPGPATFMILKYE